MLTAPFTGPLDLPLLPFGHLFILTFSHMPRISTWMETFLSDIDSACARLPILTLTPRTCHFLSQAMLGPDRRFLDPSPEEVAALTLEAAREAVQAQLLTENLEVSIVGDFDPTQLDQHLLAYLGTVRTPAAAEAARAAVESPLLLNLGIPVTDARRAQRLHLPDSDERACAYLAGPAPNRCALPPLRAYNLLAWPSCDISDGVDSSRFIPRGWILYSICVRIT